MLLVKRKSLSGPNPEMGLVLKFTSTSRSHKCPEDVKLIMQSDPGLVKYLRLSDPFISFSWISWMCVCVCGGFTAGLS